MSLIGNLEQFSLANVLRRLETYEKNGLLVVKQGSRWVEFYFREGRLLCIGPVRTSTNLVDRLVQDGVFPSHTLAEILMAVADTDQSETRVALVLMERGYVTRDELRSWAMQKATSVLLPLLSWQTGEIYFEENTPAPSDRLLVSMSVSALLEAVPAQTQPTPPMQRAQGPRPAQPFQPAQPETSEKPGRAVQPVQPAQLAPQVQTAPAVYSTVAFNTVHEQSGARSTAPAPDVSNVPTLMSASQFLDVSTFSSSPFATGLPATEAQLPTFSVPDEPHFPSPLPDTEDFSADSPLGFLSSDAPASSIYAEAVMYPVAPRHIDTSFMRPEMILIPADLSAYREQNPQVQLTPEQWRILTRADGRTSLQIVCQDLALLPEIVCQLAGELVAEGLIHVSPPQHVQQMDELSPVSRELLASGLSNGYVAPGYAAASATPWSVSVPALPSSDVLPHNSAPLPFETESQWGNGGNGATFVPGRGWVTTPQPVPPMQSGGAAMTQRGVYAQIR